MLCVGTLNSAKLAKMCEVKCWFSYEFEVVMLFLVAFVLGGISFSLCSSLGAFIVDSRRPKTPYEAWLREIAAQNVVPLRESNAVV